MKSPDNAMHRQSRPHAVPLEGSFLEVDLEREMRHLREEDTWRTGRNSKTLVKYADFRVVLMMLGAGARIEEHQAPGRLSIQTLAGRINVRASGRTFDLPAGSLLTLDRGTVHDLSALVESGILLTITVPEKPKDQQ